MTRTTFGALLRHYRLAAGLTQELLAERAGLSRRGISDLERGARHLPQRATLELLVGAMELSGAERARLAAARGSAGASADELPRPAGPGRPRRPVLPRRDPAPAAGREPHPPLVGRGEELALLEAHLEGEGPPVLLLAGEPGIGKSRLLREVVGRAAERGWQALEGGCGRRGGQEPYSPLLETLERHILQQAPTQLRQGLQGCAWLVRLLPELAEAPIEPLPTWTPTPEQERRLLFKAVARLLANVRGPAGTLLLLDDLQWAGLDGLDLLATLVRSAADGSVRAIGACRDTEVRPHDPLALTLADLAREGLAVRHVLHPLTRQEASCLLDALLAGVDAPAAMPRERILQRASGVPFYLVSYAQGLSRGQRDTARQAEARAEEVPWDVAQSIRQRVAVLPQSARELLSTAAVAGRVVPRALLTAATGQAETAVLTALETACSARLLVEAGEWEYQFAHDVIREVVEADLGAGWRALLHRRLAGALERMPGEPAIEALAYHYARSDDRDKAIMFLERAGDKARAQAAHAAAADYYGALVERLDGLGRTRDAALAREKLGAVLATMARYDAALVALGQAAEAYRVAGEIAGLARVMAETGRVCADKGTPDEGLRLLRPLVEHLEAQGPVDGLIVLYPVMARLFLGVGSYDEHLALADRAVELARATGAGRSLAEAELWRGEALLELGRVDEGLQAMQAAVTHAEAAGDLKTLASALMDVSCLYEDWGEFELRRLYEERALAVAEQRGDPLLLATMMSRHGLGAFYRGDWCQARVDFERAVPIDQQIGPTWLSPFLRLDLGRLLVAEGAWAEASAYLREALALAERQGLLFAVREVRRCLAELDLLQGKPEAALQHLLPALDRPGRREGGVTALLSRLAWARLDLGDAAEAEAVAAEAVARARMMKYRIALVDALRVQAMVFARRKRRGEAERALGEALRLARGMPYPYAEARLLHVDALLHIEEGETEPARARLEAALAIFRRLGARKDTERTEHLLATLGR